MPSMMRKLMLLATLSVSSILMPATYAALPPEVNGQPLPSLSTMLERVTPAVVNITTEGRQATNDPLLNDPFLSAFLVIRLLKIMPLPVQVLASLYMPNVDIF